MDLKDHRKKIDEIDEKLTALFLERMAVSADIAAYKKERGLPIRDPEREREKLASIMDEVSPELQPYMRTLYLTLFELGRAHQHRLCATRSDLSDRVAAAIAETPKILPDAPLVACQGVEGAYSQIACDKMFRAPNIM